MLVILNIWTLSIAWYLQNNDVLKIISVIFPQVKKFGSTFKVTLIIGLGGSRKDKQIQFQTLYVLSKIIDG
jgi:hypothetical protein